MTMTVLSAEVGREAVNDWVISTVHKSRDNVFAICNNLITGSDSVTGSVWDFGMR